MALFENFPYTNIHELNLDWIVKIAKDFLEQYTHIQQLIEDGETSLVNLKNEGLAELQEKADTLEAALQAWYDTHSEDIAHELADALTDLNAWYTQHEGYLNQYVTDSIQEFGEAADNKAASTLATIPSDYTTLYNNVVSLKTGVIINNLKNTIIPSDVYSLADTLINNQGNPITLAGYSTTPLIPITKRLICFANAFPSSTYNTFCLYDKEFNMITNFHNFAYVDTLEYPTAKYFRAAKALDDSYYVKFMDAEKYYNLPYDDIIPSDFYIMENTILNRNGIPIVLNGYYTSPYIPIPENTVFKINAFPNESYNTFAFYDETLTYITGIHGETIVTASDYPTAKYFRIAKAIDTTFFATLIENLIAPTFHVGSGYEFTSLRSAIETAISYKDSTVIVHPGTYNLTQEFSSELQNTLTGTTGLYLSNNIHVIFLASTYVKALFPVSNDSISTYFSPFYGKNFTLEGLNIESSNCRYCVHDEQAGADDAYHNRYVNCVMKHTVNQNSGVSGTRYFQCIGGGLGKHGYIEIEGGIYTTITDIATQDELPSISYHNGYTSGCDSKIFITGVYLGINNHFTFGYYGPSTVKSRIIINNCSMGRAILKRPETPDSTVDNFEIVEWNNIVRN